MQVRLVAALASAAVLISAGAAPAQTTVAPTSMPVVGPTAAASPMPMGGMASAKPATMPVPTTSLALDARGLRGTRTKSGYRLTGQAEVRDACTAARFQQFVGTIFPPLYNVVQYRRPGTLGLLCIQRLTWVTIAPLAVMSTHPPSYVSIHTAKGTTRVPIH